MQHGIVINEGTAEVRTLWPSMLSTSGVTMPKILIDPGHGGKDNPGAVAGLGFGKKALEADLNLEVALALADAVGYWLDLNFTRTEDQHCPWAERVMVERQFQPDLVVSIHHNAGPSQGGEVYCTASGGLSNVARVVCDAMPLGGRVIIPQEKDYPRAHWLLHQYRAPVMLVECGYMTSPKDLEICNSNAGQIANATAIALGLAYWQLWEHNHG